MIASELGLLYGIGKHWTGSMIDLSRNHSMDFNSFNYKFKYNLFYNENQLTKTYGDQLFLFRYQDRTNHNFSGYSGEYIPHKRMILTNHELRSKVEENKHQSPRTSLQRQFSLNLSLRRHFKEVIYQLINEKKQLRHSYTNILPTENKDQQTYQMVNRDISKHGKVRCNSCEPVYRKRNGELSTVEHNDDIRISLNASEYKRLEIAKSVDSKMCSNITKHIRLFNSDNDIRYKVGASNIEIRESIPEKENCQVQSLPFCFNSEPSGVEVNTDSNSFIDTKLLVIDETKFPPTNELEDVSVGSNCPVEQPQIELNPDISEEDITINNDVQTNVTFFAENISEDVQTDVSETEKYNNSPSGQKESNKSVKSVRFADEAGDQLVFEKIIVDSYLPPVLSRKRFDSLKDDFENDEDNCVLPSLTRFNISNKNFNKIYPPPIPRSASCSIVDSLPNQSPNTCKPVEEKLHGVWGLTFPQPAAQYLAFRRRIDVSCISLEHITIGQSKNSEIDITLYGTIKVKNIAFEKYVNLRITRDNWKTFKDYPASHNVELSNQNGNNSMFDIFIFNLSLKNDADASHEIQFAVQLIAGGKSSGNEYWDNNDGCNYIIIKSFFPKSTARHFNNQIYNSSPNIFGNEHSSNTNTSTVNSFRRNPSRVFQSRSRMGNFPLMPIRPRPPSPYTLDYRPNFTTFNTLTNYSSTQHYSSEAMYY